MSDLQGRNMINRIEIGWFTVDRVRANGME